MAKISRFLVNIATYTFITTLVSLVVEFLSKEGSTVQANSSNFAFYGAMITVLILCIHLLFIFVSFMFKVISDQSKG